LEIVQRAFKGVWVLPPHLCCFNISQTDLQDSWPLFQKRSRLLISCKVLTLACSPTAAPLLPFSRSTKNQSVTTCHVNIKHARTRKELCEMILATNASKYMRRSCSNQIAFYSAAWILRRCVWGWELAAWHTATWNLQSRDEGSSISRDLRTIGARLK
jgi:hypothetical protein